MAQFRKDTHQFLNDGKTIFETVMLADQYGDIVGAANPSGMSVDAFGRARTSHPLTIFDSSHRYDDNGLWATSNTATATYAFDSNEGLVDLVLDTTSDAEVIRETKKVFGYQPGKSLQVLNTFVMEPAKENLRQRVGYFGAQNGLFLEQDGTDIYFVKRSYVTGSVVDTKVAQANWNVDVMDGTGPSLKTLDLSKAQILFCDIEWLGVGSSRMGFVIDGKFIHCHSFHHSNEITSTYMTTASLPLRYEIKNTAATANNSTLSQICSTVISEGGYELRGTQQAIGTPVTAPVNLAVAGTFYPIVSLRLKNTRNDAIVIITALSMLGVGNNARFEWRILSNPTLGGNTTFTSAGSDSSVEYNQVANTVTGGRTLASGYLTSTTQASVATDILKEALFKFQLERDSLANTSHPFTVAVAPAVAGDDVLVSIDWEEVSR
jgi:hypothetical protein